MAQSKLIATCQRSPDMANTEHERFNATAADDGVTSVTSDVNRKPLSTSEKSDADNSEGLYSKFEDDIDQEMSRSESTEDETDDADMGAAATRRNSTVSVAEQLPLFREILFVMVICLAQLYTRKFLLC